MARHTRTIITAEKKHKEEPLQCLGGIWAALVRYWGNESGHLRECTSSTRTPKGFKTRPLSTLPVNFCFTTNVEQLSENCYKFKIFSTELLKRQCVDQAFSMLMKRMPMCSGQVSMHSPETNQPVKFVHRTGRSPTFLLLPRVQKHVGRNAPHSKR